MCTVRRAQLCALFGEEIHMGVMVRGAHSFGHIVYVIKDTCAISEKPDVAYCDGIYPNFNIQIVINLSANNMSKHVLDLYLHSLLHQPYLDLRWIKRWETLPVCVFIPV